MDLPLSSFVSHLSLLTVQGVNLQYIAHDKICESSVFSIVTGLIAEVLLVLFFICNAMCTRLNRAENKV